MAQEKPNRLAEWIHILRTQAPIIRQRLVEWVGEMLEEPALIWQTAAVRYVVYGLGGLVLLWIVSYAPGLMSPPLPAGAKSTATTADYHVICNSNTCGRHFVIHREFGFRNFPVACIYCKNVAAKAARRCNSQTCNGRWTTPISNDGAPRCAICDRDY